MSPKNNGRNEYEKTQQDEDFTHDSPPKGRNERKSTQREKIFRQGISNGEKSEKVKKRQLK